MILDANYVGQCRICKCHIEMDEATPTVWHGQTDIDGPFCWPCMNKHAHTDICGEIVLNIPVAPEVREALGREFIEAVKAEEEAQIIRHFAG